MVEYPGAHRRSGGRVRLASARCLEHAVAYCRLHAIPVPGMLARQVAERAARLGHVHDDHTRIGLLEERMRVAEVRLNRVEGR
jgi:hypothetical protein